MTVFPDSTLYIISGCPCDPDYEHTLYWPNKEGQHAYFMTKAKYKIHDMSYQRAKCDRIRVQYKVEDLYDCNYIAFKNTSFGNKWFYAFIDDVTYVNNITSEISYTIDVIQTWITEMDLQQSFVVREHSTTDVAGDNLIPEDVETGEMVASAWHIVNPFTSFKIVMAQAYEDAAGTPVSGKFYGETFAQVRYVTFPCTASGISAIQSWIQSLGLFGNNNAIVSIFMAPDSVLIEGTDTPTSKTVYTQADTRVSLVRSDGSAVKNQKLNTYPYTYLAVTDCNGTVNKYAFEYFVNSIPKFEVHAGYSSNISLVLIPVGYKVGTSEAFNPVETLHFDGFPECMWGSDATANRMVTSIMSGALGAISGATTGGAVGALVGGLVGGTEGLMSGTVADTNADWSLLQPPAKREDTSKRTNRKSKTARKRPPLATQVASSLLSTPIRPLPQNTHVGNPVPLYNAGAFGFRQAQMRPLPQFIDRIDDYFSRYGYKTNRIKTPNISSRPQWNYVQTIGCKIGGSIPCQDEKLICSIFDNGVTFWKHPENVGNFSLDNSPS